MSLPQCRRTAGGAKDQDERTAEQMQRFRRGLAWHNVWYGAMYTHTIVLNTPMPKGAENSSAYLRPDTVARTLHVRRAVLLLLCSPRVARALLVR